MALARKQQDFNSKENSAISLIDNYLDNPDNHHDTIGDRIDKHMVMDEVFGYAPGSVIPKDIEAMWSTWCNGQKAWKKLKPTRIGGRVSRGWERILRPGEEPAVISFNMVDSKDDPALREIMCQALFRKLNRKHDFYEGGPFPYEEVTSEELDELIHMGYIYDKGLPSEPDWRIAYLP